ncbi:ATP-binding cassette domain-containing protein [Anaerosporobacter faecicola]|uniref:ATP-binding cassette domain-containing protein n=1 Tax=Anaerosporobacter faecicola TaxID=2718714 RepID=UPI0014388B95|nr:ABC transporter ATP-binding protein [Anaerosporobacter faecicola]
MDHEQVISISKLNKKFKDFELNIPELNIPKGFATALIGENGAGKSTLLNILAGIRCDYTGKITYFDGADTEKEIREKIGYTGPGNYFIPHWTSLQVAKASSLLFDHFHKDRFDRLCKELDIFKTAKSKKGVSKLSDGMRMKLMLATVFARDTDLLLLDEPASPLDPLMRDKLCSMMREYLDQGNGEKSVFFSTHNIADMENVTDYAIIMEQGMVVEQGYVEELKEKYILVKGEAADYEKVKHSMYSIQKNSYGFTGLCLSEKLDELAGIDVVTEIPTLSQICVSVMKQYTVLHA